MFKHLTKVLAFIAGLLLLTTLGLTTAAASVQSPTRATNTSVAPITCAQEDSCVRDYTCATAGCYWMARQANGTTWVRLTLVPGWTTVGVAPITCQYEDSCMWDYTGGAWWAAQQSHGVRTSVWVRTTLVDGQ